MAGAIDVQQLAVARTLHRPQIWISGLGPSSLVGSSIAVENTLASCSNPRRSRATCRPVRRGEVSAAPGIEQILDSVEVEKEGVAAAAGEERIVAGLDDIRLGAEGDFGVGDDLRPDRFRRARSSPFAKNTLTVCLPFSGFENT